MEVDMKKFLLSFLVIFLIIACAGDKEEAKEAKDTKEVATPFQDLSVQFDVDNLIGKRITDVKKILGRPSAEFIPNQEQLKIDPNIPSWAEWHKSEVGLQMDFKVGEKIDYIFVINEKSKYTKQDLIKIANLVPDSNRYIIKEQRSLSGQGITGLHVCGKGVQNTFCP